MRFRKILVLGGARSGKSRYAQDLVEDSGKNKVFIATAEALDIEMAARIEVHRRDRGDDWQAVEAPLALAGTIRARPENEAVVVDCLTLWLSNIMHAGQDVDAAIAELAAAVAQAGCRLVLVSNEVGCGLVPETPLGRRFRDWHGRLNQALGRECDAVVMMVAGCPMRIKPAATAIVLG